YPKTKGTRHRLRLRPARRPHSQPSALNSLLCTLLWGVRSAGAAQSVLVDLSVRSCLREYARQGPGPFSMGVDDSLPCEFVAHCVALVAGPFQRSFAAFDGLRMIRRQIEPLRSQRFAGDRAAPEIKHIPEAGGLGEFRLVQNRRANGP